MPAASPDDPPAPRPLAGALRRLVLLVLSLVVVTSPGCGCRQETPQERAARLAREKEEQLKRLEEDKKRKKPPIETRRPLPQPNQVDQPLVLVKPGHWMTATQQTKANYEDWVGQAELQVVDRKNQPVAIERTAFTLRTSRDAALVKGKEKALETSLFVPNTFDAQRIETSLLSRGGTLAARPVAVPVTRLLPHQYHFVILAAEPARYGFLRNGNYAVDAPLPARTLIFGPDTSVLPARRQYRVVAPSVDERPPLSDNPLCWTSTAYVLWDEVDPERLDPQQRQAVVDWLHWGGQLLVSGPDSLDLLADSFLTPYLPADSTGARPITADDLAPLARAYQAGEQRRAARLAADGAWSGVGLKLRPEAEPIPQTGGLFAERRVGRGRVIVSAMQLAERELINWAGGFENLFNAVLLRRPPRRFAWENINDGLLTVIDAETSLPRLDAAANTRLRFFARDTYATEQPFAYRPQTRQEAGAQQGGAFGLVPGGLREDETTLVPGDAAGGVGAWNDFNAAASAARAALREAAGVRVPGRGFVLACLGVYLAVLGPVNWFFFKALGRVELAWVAAPVITLVGTVAVVRLAELDIGFARAQTEIAVLETQPGHPRAHLTRYTALYTSLATTYEYASDEPTTLIAPFARRANFELLRGQRLTDVAFERRDGVRLRGFAVSSAATDMVHTEQLIGLPEALSFDPDARRVVNRTGLDLDSLAVVKRTDDGRGEPRLLGSWIGSLPNDEGVSVSFTPIAFSEEEPVYAAQRANEAGQTDAERLNLEPLFRLALDPARLEPGEVRAVARVDEVLPGLNVKPRAAQVTGATLLVAHLDYAPLPPPASDANAPIDVRPERR